MIFAKRYHQVLAQVVQVKDFQFLLNHHLLQVQVLHQALDFLHQVPQVPHLAHLLKDFPLNLHQVLHQVLQEEAATIILTVFIRTEVTII